MKSRRALIAGFGLGLGIWGFIIWRKLLSPPLRFDKTKFYFGILEWNKKAEHTFYFTNVSDRVVKIVNIRKSCRCIEVKVSSFLIKPKQKGFLTVKFSSYGLIGDVRHYVWLWLKGFKHPLTLCLRAKIMPPLVFVPSEVDFGQMKPSDISSKTVILKKQKQKSNKNHFYQNISELPQSYIAFKNS